MIRSRKGSTLVEICVVLAIVSIASALIFSFCVLANNRSVTSANRLKIMNEIKLLEDFIQDWSDDAFGTEEDIILNEGALWSGDSSLMFKDGKLIFASAENEEISSSFETVRALEFDLLPSSKNGANPLIFCNVTCKVPVGSEGFIEENFTFCVTSRVGEIFGGEYAEQ